MSIPIITIDGPSGVGKGTIALQLAQKLGFELLDSGAIYRLAALSLSQKSIDINNLEGVLSCINEMDIHFETGEELCIAYLDQKDVGASIRDDKVAVMASKIAVIPEVRVLLLDVQKGFAKAPGLIADGRDMGTTVFPNANCKFYLIASAEERAKRRYKQLIDMGVECNIATLLNDINERDERDTTRKVSPMKPAEDAIVVDTTSLSFESVLKLVVSHVEETLSLIRKY